MNNRLLVPRKTPGLLDLVPGAAAAYSLRSLSNSYAGPVVTVRRSSDDAEEDFTAAEVSDGTLASFCGAGDGFVTQWYDQSNNARHCYQTDGPKQPKCIVSGIPVTLEGRPAIQFFSASNTFLATVRDTTLQQPAHLFLLGRFVALNGLNTSPRGLFGRAYTGSGTYIRERTSDVNIGSSVAIYTGSVGYDTEPHLWNVMFNGASSFYRLDFITVAEGDAGSAGPEGAMFGSDAKISGRSSDSIISEAVLYGSASTDSQAIIEGNMAWSYSV